MTLQVQPDGQTVGPAQPCPPHCPYGVCVGPADDVVELVVVVFIVVLLLVVTDVLVVTEVLVVVDVLEEVIVEVVELPPGLITVSISLPESSLMIDHENHYVQHTVNVPCNLISLLEAPTYMVNAPLGTTHFCCDTFQ